jgi:RNA polymerase sigma factor (sigma-70 family)
MEAILNLEMTQKKNGSLSESVKKYGNKLLSFIRSKVAVLEDAEDILQDVWYQMSNIADLDEIENVSGWLYKVAKNRITDKYRKKSNDLLEDFSFENEDGGFDFKEILLLDDSGSPELALYKEYFWQQLMDALEELPEKQREVFVLNEIEDFTLQQIADQKNENLKTIISRKAYAMKHLRTKLEHLYKDLIE